MSSDPARTAVVIVGAGPAGLVIGHLLQHEAIPFVLLERHGVDDFQGRPKAGVVEYRTVRLLTEVGIADRIVQFDAENSCCEFRTPDRSVVFDYGAITGGRPHYIYPQHELVARLGAALVASGADVRFGATVTDVHPGSDGVTVTMADAHGALSTLRGEVLIGCDGARSTIAASLTSARVVEDTLPVRWLAVIGRAAPLVPHTIYAAHPRGFAGHMRRGPTQTRYYLEVPAADGVTDWPEARVRQELTSRLCVPSRLDGIAFVEPTLVDLRTRMIMPMQQGPIFLAGDAAHLLTPAGGKGMNLAVQDAVELAHGLIDRLGPRHDEARLASYSDTRLPEVWRTQAFSNWMLRLILAGSDGVAADRTMTFGRGLREGWVSALERDPLLGRWFSHAYAGVDLD